MIIYSSDSLFSNALNIENFTKRRHLLELQFLNGLWFGMLIHLFSIQGP